MALPDLQPSPAEAFWIWTKRITGSVLLVTLEFIIFLKLLSRPPYWIGAVTSPAMAFATWQVVSRIMTREYFSLSLDPMTRTGRQLADLLCTVAFLLNALFFLYHLMTWYTEVPK